MTEIWKKVVGFSRYEVSNLGQVRSLILDKPKILKQSKGSAGYRGVTLCKNGKYSCNVHRLVLEAFVGSCPSGYWAAHNDGNPLNNHIENLRWDTPSNNQADKKRHGTYQIGENSGHHKLTEQEVREIRRKYIPRKYSLIRLGKEYGVSNPAISLIVLRKTWKHI